MIQESTVFKICDKMGLLKPSFSTIERNWPFRTVYMYMYDGQTAIVPDLIKHG